MGKIFRTFALMVVSGNVAICAMFLLVIIVFGEHGKTQVGINMILIYGAGLLGFLAPGVIVWRFHKRGTSKTGRYPSEGFETSG